MCEITLAIFSSFTYNENLRKPSKRFNSVYKFSTPHSSYLLRKSAQQCGRVMGWDDDDNDDESLDT